MSQWSVYNQFNYFESIEKQNSQFIQRNFCTRSRAASYNLQTKYFCWFLITFKGDRCFWNPNWSMTFLCHVCGQNDIFANLVLLSLQSLLYLFNVTWHYRLKSFKFIFLISTISDLHPRRLQMIMTKFRYQNHEGSLMKKVSISN